MKIYQRIFVGLGLVLGLALALNSPAVAAPQNKATGGASTSGANLGRIAQQLNLTPTQQTKIMAIQQSQRPQLMAIYNNKSFTPNQKQAKMIAVMSGMMGKISAVLTPAQRKKVAAMRGQQMARRAG